MELRGYGLLWLFFVYSFLGWMIETVVAAGKQKRFVNRGFYSGPMCFVYGVSAVLMTVVLPELYGNIILQFLGCTVLATTVEWFTGKLLERITGKRWWVFRNSMEFDGYICLPYSILWGILGVLALRFGNEVLLVAYGLLPRFVGKLIVWVLSGLTVLDFLTSMAAVRYGQNIRSRGKQFRTGSVPGPIGWEPGFWTMWKAVWKRPTQPWKARPFQRKPLCGLPRAAV